MSEQTAGAAVVKFAAAMREDAFARGDLEGHQAFEHIVRLASLAETQAKQLLERAEQAEAALAELRTEHAALVAFHAGAMRFLESQGFTEDDLALRGLIPRSA